MRGFFMVMCFVVSLCFGPVYAADSGSKCPNGKCGVSKCPNGKCQINPPVRKRVRR